LGSWLGKAIWAFALRLKRQTRNWGNVPASRQANFNLPMTNQIFGFFAIAVGLAIGIFFVRAIARQRATRAWLAARGQVAESRIQDNGSSLEPYVKYTYVVRGTTYTSDRIAPNNYVTSAPASAASLASAIARYPAGKSVDVYYDPNSPDNAVLEKTDAIFPNIVILSVSLVFIGFGLAMAFGK
jgi:hypothetical protein